MEFESLLKKYSRRIKHLAIKSAVPSSAIDKEDLYQEMVYHLWERWRKGELEDKTDAYIIGSCYFHLKNYLRRFKPTATIASLHDPIGEEEMLLEELIPDRKALVEQRVDDVLFIRKLKEKEFTRREKEVVELLAEGYTLREISQKLAISHVRVLKIKKNISKKFKKGGYQK
ncbi:MAG: sigma-70 family RNA polymerase sigma factor [bacterium]|nr:sigma-70 family RNA polymerase sigma factor [bacterium]